MSGKLLGVTRSESAPIWSLDMRFSPARAGLCLMLILLPIVIHLPIDALGGKLTILEPITLLTFCAWFIGLCLGTRKLVLIPTVYGALLAFLAACLFSFFASPDWRASIVEFLAYVYGGLILFLILQLVRDSAGLHRAVNWLLIGTFVPLSLSMIGLLAQFSNTHVGIVLSSAGKLTASFRFSNQLPAYLLIVIPLLVYTSLQDTRRRSVRFIAGLGASVGVAAILGSGSRSGFLAGIITILGYLVWRVSWRRHMLGVALVVLAVVGIASSMSVFDVVPNPIRRSISGIMLVIDGNSTLEDLSHSRADQLAAVVQVIKESPIFGIGIGSFAQQIDDLLERDVKDLEVHSTPLSLWVETGFLGLSAFIGLCMFVIISGLKSIARSAKDDQYLTAALVTGLLGNLIHQQFHLGLRQPVFWVSLGLVMAAAVVQSRERAY